MEREDSYISGTVAGGLRAAATNKERHGEGFYARIGAIGGAKSSNGGYATQRQCDGSCFLDDIVGYGHKVSQCSGYKGGIKSRRGKAKPKVEA